MKVGVPREVVPGEHRVALIPETVQKLARSGIGAIVEAGAGARAYHADDAYRAAGATIVTGARAVFADADVIVKVRPPLADDSGVDEIAAMRETGVLLAILQPLVHPDIARRLADRRITAFSLDAIPRIARAQALDVLSSMSTVAGYHAVLLAAGALPRFFPLLMTAAGTLTPARVFIIGAGVAGLQAIATARRLGAVTEAFDTRPAVKEQVQSLGATFVDASLGVTDAEDQRGYAKELSEDAHRREQELIAQRVRDADVVITTALVPGRRAPVLITAPMVRAMRPGSVIVDLAAEQGGNCELSRPGERVVDGGVTVLAPVNIPSAMPAHASQMFSRNVAAFLQLIVKDGALHLDFQDQIIRDSCITHDGRIVHEPIRTLLEGAGAR